MTAPFLADAELWTILARGEGQFVEFKSAWDLGSSPPKRLGRRVLRDKIADVVAAFANADGGLLLVGVDDDGSVSGHGYSERDVEAFFEVPHRRLAPAPDCQTARFNRESVLRNADYRALFEIDRHGALRELRRLVALKVLAGSGTGRGTRYVLASPPE